MISSLYTKYKQISEHVVFFSMLLIAVSLFFSRFLISVGFILVVLNWLFEGGIKEKISFVKQNKTGFYIVLMLLFHLIGMVYTENIWAGLNDLRIKSFLFIIVAYGSGVQLNKKRKEGVLHIYILAALLASIISSLDFYVVRQISGIEDLGGMSLVGGNLFQAFMVVFAISLLCRYLLLSKNKTHRLLYLATIFWFVFYLFLLNALTGYMLLFALLVYSFVFLFFKMKSSTDRLKMIAFFMLVFILASIYFATIVKGFYRSDRVDFSGLPETTMNGNSYLHDTVSGQKENGHFVRLYLCEKELRKEWGARSSFDFGGTDKKEQKVAQTLIRYLSSKNLTKDSVGVWSLRNEDVSAVENGYANYLYVDKFSLKARIYIVLWQLDKYFSQGYANRQTISQRIVYMKVARRIIEDYFWFGVGPGDVLDKSKEYTAMLNAGVTPHYTSRVHNQFLLEFVGLGVLGFVAFVFILFYPYFKNKLWKDYLFGSFYLIVVLSFFVDNLLEVQLGMAFFAFIYSILAFDNKEARLVNKMPEI